MLDAGDPFPPKGWVRDAVLTMLAKGPLTTTEIAAQLGVSKATVSYHTKALTRRDLIQIEDVKSVRGGVYSKTYSLKRGGLVLARRRDEQEGSLAKLDELFERLLVSWHLEPSRAPADEMKVFLYHLFRLLADSGSMTQAIFEEYGARVGREMVAPSIGFSAMASGLDALSGYLEEKGMAHLTVEARKGADPRILCLGCFENKQYGSLVCWFTKGIISGAIRAKHTGRFRLRRLERKGAAGCLYEVRTRGFRD